MDKHSATYGCGNIHNFILMLEARDFIVQEGKLRYVDIQKLCSEGKVDSCFGNNVGAPYAIGLLPPAPNQDPSWRQPPMGNQTNYPANINYIFPGATYKMNPDEAVVLIGYTPPPAYYFSYRSYLFFSKNKPKKDYSDIFTIGNEYTGVYHRVFASLGDSINNFNIWTDDTPRGRYGNPFNSSTVIISSADKSVNKEIRKILNLTGYSSNIINDDIIPQGLVNMGLEKGKDHFFFLMRAAIWANKDIGDEYLYNLDNYIKILRITPKHSTTYLNPYPVPTLKIRETRPTEFKIISNARNDFDYLRNMIIKKYGSEEYNHVGLNTWNWMDGYEGILQDLDIAGDISDAAYLHTDYFQLKTNNDFLIIYGVDHVKTGKAVYFNSSLYGKKYFNGVAAFNNVINVPNSAIEYFPEGYENASYYYVYKMARKCDGEDCIIIPSSTGNPYGKAYGVDNNKDVRLLFRIYIDQRTKVGPAYFDVIWDRAILFTKKKSLWVFSKQR